MKNKFENIDSLVFVINTPDGTNYKRILKTNAYHVGRLKAGSPVFNDPSEISRPPWLTSSKFLMLYNMYSKKKKVKVAVTQKELIELWQILLTQAEKPKDQDYSENYLKSNFGDTLEPKQKTVVRDTKPRENKSIDVNNKIKHTNKEAKSEKNKLRISLYSGDIEIYKLLEKHKNLSLADIKYDIKCGYAEIIT